ncbi:MAG: hypothetical protein Q4C01_02015 [Clostridia bacterium]|nr:hypothetical protein [Clostridia bacterium]
MPQYKRVFRTLSLIFANMLIVLGCVYILFAILDVYNPLLHFLSDSFFLTMYLEEVMIGLGLALAICSIVSLWRTKRRKKQ